PAGPRRKYQRLCDEADFRRQRFGLLHVSWRQRRRESYPERREQRRPCCRCRRRRLCYREHYVDRLPDCKPGPADVAWHDQCLSREDRRLEPECSALRKTSIMRTPQIGVLPVMLLALFGCQRASVPAG